MMDSMNVLGMDEVNNLYYMLCGRFRSSSDIFSLNPVLKKHQVDEQETIFLRMNAIPEKFRRYYFEYWRCELNDSVDNNDKLYDWSRLWNIHDSFIEYKFRREE